MTSKEYVKQYMNGDKPLFKLNHEMMGIDFYDVGNSFDFTNGKDERNKLIYHLKRLGFRHYYSYYIHFTKDRDKLFK